jgi:hypothetical protein
LGSDTLKCIFHRGGWIPPPRWSHEKNKPWGIGLKPLAKFHNPRTTPSGRKVCVVVVYYPGTTPSWEKVGKFPLTPMGVLVPGFAHARAFAQPPIDVSGNFLRRTLKISKVFLINFISKSVNSKHFFFKPIFRGGICLKSFFNQFSRQILSTFHIFYFVLKKIKIVVIIFACHLHKSSGMCLQLGKI